MPFKRLKSALVRQDWFAVALELVIVVAGILIALAANDWVEAGRDRDIELEMLRELRVALENDVNEEAGIVVTASQLHTALESSQALLDHLRSGEPYSDDLDPHWDYLAITIYGARDLTAYRTLQTRGMETLTNDSLRVGLGRLYGGTYELLSQVYDVMNDATVSVTLPYLLDRVIFGDAPLSGAEPVDYEMMRQDPMFQNLVRSAVLVQGTLVAQHDAAVAQIRSLIAQIDEEIERLN